jgi:2-methylcitrate dehydratase PrpD
MSVADPARNPAVAEKVADALTGVTPAGLPPDVVSTVRRLLLDVAGLCVVARRETYVSAVLATASDGICTVLGHPGGFDPFSAALANGTAAHGEDYDDTFEGGPVHSGAVIVPAVLAACERDQLGGERLLAGVATGVELLCRLSLVAPKATHDAGFHPTAVFGALAAAAGVSVAQGLPAPAIASALGIAGSMASGIIEYLAEGAWTKRMHAGWAAQSGIRAALMARAGFVGPRTVFEGRHGLFRAFAPSVPPDFAPLVDGLTRSWVMPTVAFKPYACGTMTQPFVDCAIALARTGVQADDIAEIVCDVAAGTVPRLWEPLDAKHRPSTPYAAKFSTPFCIAVSFFDRKAGLAQFSDGRLGDPAVLALCAKIRYIVDPDNDYPRSFSGRLRAVLKDGSARVFSQPHLRGGAHAPLSDEELMRKFADNAAGGGWSPATADRFERLTRSIFDQPRLAAFAEFRT